MRAKFAEITVKHGPHAFYPVIGRRWDSFTDSRREPQKAHTNEPALLSAQRDRIWRKVAVEDVSTRVDRTTGRRREERGAFEAPSESRESWTIEVDQLLHEGCRVFPHTWGMAEGVSKECDRGMML